MKCKEYLTVWLYNDRSFIEKVKFYIGGRLSLHEPVNSIKFTRILAHVTLHFSPCIFYYHDV